MKRCGEQVHKKTKAQTEQKLKWSCKFPKRWRTKSLARAALSNEKCFVFSHYCCSAPSFQSYWCLQLCYLTEQHKWLYVKLINNSIFPLKWKPFFDGIIYGHLQQQILLFSISVLTVPPSATLLTFMLWRCTQTWSCSLGMIGKPRSWSCNGLLLSYGVRAAANSDREQKLEIKPTVKQNNKPITSSDPQQWPLIGSGTEGQDLRVAIITWSW